MHTRGWWSFGRTRRFVPLIYWQPSVLAFAAWISLPTKPGPPDSPTGLAADALVAVRAAQQEYLERSGEEPRGHTDQDESRPRVTLRDRKSECPNGSKYDSGLDRMLLHPLPNSSVKLLHRSINVPVWGGATLGR